MFRNQFEEHSRVNCNPGERHRIIKGGVLNKQKNIVVEEKGTEDFYAFINSHADSVNIHVLLNRFANGDKEALIRRAGAFIDISAMPTNINEFVDLYHKGQNYFNTLPVEVKEKFNHNIVEFISKIGTDEFNEALSVSPQQIIEKKVEKQKEVKEVFKEQASPQFDSTVFGSDYNVEVVTPGPAPIIEKGNKK